MDLFQTSVLGLIQQTRKSSLSLDATTDNINEGSNNLYFTANRARSAIAGEYPIIYNVSTGVISFAPIFTDLNLLVGFRRNAPTTMGIIEFSPNGMDIFKIDYMGNFTSEASGIFARGTSYQTTAIERTFVIYPSDSSFEFYANGRRYTKNTLLKITINDTTGIHYINFNSYGDLEVSSSFDPNKCQVALVYWNSEENKLLVFADERHGAQMDASTHNYLHLTQGMKWISGAEITGLSQGATSYTDITSGMFLDEDIMLSLPTQLAAPFWYLTGDKWNSSVSNTLLSLKGNDDKAQYNLFVNDNWSLAEVPNATDTYVLTHFFATNGCKTPYVKVLGRGYYWSQQEARLAVTREIYNIQSKGLPTPEVKPIGSVIVRGDGTLALADTGELYIDTRRLPK